VRPILFDENLPRQLRRDLAEFTIRTVQEEGWGSFKNGQLLRRAETMFEVLVTADRRMQFQQNLASFSIGVVVIVTPRLRLQTLRTVIEPLRAAIASVQPGEIVTIHVSPQKS
jgi:predicted nuclease of predicted toxin-antitoxin system